MAGGESAIGRALAPLFEDHSRLFFSLAALCCALLLVYRSLLLRSWL